VSRFNPPIAKQRAPSQAYCSRSLAVSEWGNWKKGLRKMIRDRTEMRMKSDRFGLFSASLECASPEGVLFIELNRGRLNVLAHSTNTSGNIFLFTALFYITNTTIRVFR
jgi:hypothetical protein